MSSKEKLNVIGIMSGTSLDGVDILCAEFNQINDRYHYDIQAAESFPYEASMKASLAGAHKLSGIELYRLDLNYGFYLGSLVEAFLKKHPLIKATLVSSHGHTVIHQPEKSLGIQIGHGAAIYRQCGLKVVNDFRIMDMCFGGQGAPLVPIGDALLFPEYHACLNLGGICNLSIKKENAAYLAFDITACNLVLNYLSRIESKDFDLNGEMASQGKLIPEVLKKLNDLPYLKTPPPKSLDKEAVLKAIIPLLDTSKHNIKDLSATFCEHIAIQLSKAIPLKSNQQMLISGGGAHHLYLIDRIKTKTEAEVCVPDKLLIDFKEALIFAFMGYLRYFGRPNILEGTTGSNLKVSSGSIWG